MTIARVGPLAIELLTITRYWRVGVYHYLASNVLAIGPVQFRWRRR